MFDGQSLWFRFVGPLTVAVILMFVFLDAKVAFAALVVVLIFGRMSLGWYNTLEQRDIDDAEEAKKADRQSQKKR